MLQQCERLGSRLSFNTEYLTKKKVRDKKVVRETGEKVDSKKVAHTREALRSS